MSWTGVITNGGADLLDAWAAGGTLRIIRAAAGTGTVPEVALMAQTALAQEKQSASIVAHEQLEAGHRFKLQITAPETGYELNQYGIWASLDNGESTLLALFQNADSVAIPAMADTPDFVYTFFAFVAVSNSDTMQVSIDASATVTQSTMEQCVATALSASETSTRAMLAPVEATSTASQAHAVGELLIYDGVLREVTAAIAQGDTLEVGTNLSSEVTLYEEVTRRLAGKADLVGGKVPLAQLPDDIGGGLLPQIVVTGPTTGSTVTATKSGSSAVALTESNGTWTGNLPDYGTWTITATLGSSTASDTVTVTEVKQYSLTLAYFNATINVTAPSGSTVTVEKNGTTVATHTGTGSAVAVNVHETGTYTITATSGSEAATDTASITTDGQSVSVTLAFVHIYGVSWDGTSTTAWTRTDDAANFTDPVPYVAGASSYGSPFDDLLPWSGMTRVTDSEAGEMVKIPKFWYKITQSGNGLKIQIADKATDGFSVSPAHMDRGDGSGERDVVYIGRYHCASDYKSKTGVNPLGNQTRATFRSGISALGSKVWMADWAMRFTLFLLYLVEFADWNTQAKIGYGCGNNSGVQNMGYTDSMTYHTGTTQSSRTTYGLGTQYRWIEGLWDNVRDWIDGCYNSSNGLMIILNPASGSDSSGGVSVGTPSSGYPSKFAMKDVSGTFPLFIPTEASGSDSTYSCDNWGFGASSPCVNVGGGYGQGTGYGLFYFNDYGAAGKNAGIGSRSMKLP